MSKPYMIVIQKFWLDKHDRPNPPSRDFCFGSNLHPSFPPLTGHTQPKKYNEQGTEFNAG